MELLNHVLTMVWALRWVLVLLAFAFLGWLYAEALIDLKAMRAERDRLRMSNRILIGAQRGRSRARRPIIAGRVIR